MFEDCYFIEKVGLFIEYDINAAPVIHEPMLTEITVLLTDGVTFSP